MHSTTKFSSILGGMKAIITSAASLFVASTSSHKVKSSIKQRTALLIALGLLFGGVTVASSISEKKWQAPATAVAKKNPVAVSETSIAAGQKLYSKHCASCHGPSGDGDGSAAADLGIHPAKLSESRSDSDGALFWKITNGKKPMPGYGAKLSEADRWSLINYIRTLAGK
jgi:mono/diheme cytochrome c family protein